MTTPARAVVDKEYRTQDHPAANGRQPQHGEQAWTFIFPLEDGTKLRVQTGKKSRAALLNMANQEAADDAIEAALGAGGRRCDLPGCDVDYGVTCQHSQEVIITDLRARLAAVDEHIETLRTENRRLQDVLDTVEAERDELLEKVRNMPPCANSEGHANLIVLIDMYRDHWKENMTRVEDLQKALDAAREGRV